MSVITFVGIWALSVNAAVVETGKSYIITREEAAQMGDFDCVIVLGCLVRGTELSDMLADRMRVGVDLYHAVAGTKLIVSGDHGTVEYDEVNAMSDFAEENGVPREDIFLDHAGFCTYDSMYRALHVFKAQRVLIVTQSYHLYRAIYIARQLGLDAYGVSADLQTYYGQLTRDLREFIARNKDYLSCIFRPPSQYVGEAIPINSSSGIITRDK